MLEITRRVCLALAFVAAASVIPAVAQDGVHGVTYELSDADSSAVGPAADDCKYGACTCCTKESIWTRPTLTGDWLGWRSCLQESGITFAGRSTHYAFGIEGGINTPVPPPLGQGDTFKYTGRGEYDLIFDLEKFGGMPHGKLLVRAQHWYGEFGNVSLNSGAFAPPVFPAVLPPQINDQGVPYITDFVVTQPLSEKLVLFAGKKNVIGGADQDIFAGGNGTDQFINQALIANPAFLLALPYSSVTAGVAMPRQWGVVSAYVYDPQDRTDQFFSQLEDLFSEGVIVGGEVKVNTNFLCMPGEHHVGGIWKHLDMVDLSADPPYPTYPYPPAPPGAPTIRDSYTVYYGFDQYLKLYSNEPRRGWGFFGRVSISDANPTPLRYFLSAGIGGDSPVRCHRGDSFGIGWYYVGASDEFGQIAQAKFGPRDGTGAELFYNFQVTPWLNITPDLQIVRPGWGAVATDDAFIYGLRVNMKL